MGKVADLHKIFLKEVGLVLTQFGFPARDKGRSFRRPGQFGFESVHFSFINHVSDFDITMDFAIRVDAVEDIINQYRDNLTSALKRQTATIGVEYGNLIGTGQHRWSVVEDSDLHNVIKSIERAFLDAGVSYFERFKTLEAIFDVLKNDNEFAMLHRPINTERAKRAVAMSKILKSDETEALIESKLKFLASVQDKNIDSFRLFLEQLNG